MGSIRTLPLAVLTAAALAAPALAQAPWTAQGRLEDGDAQAEEQHRYDEHRVRLEAGQRYRISASSGDFDTLIRLYAPGGGEPVAENDDSGGSLNSRISYTPQQSGDYVLRVTSFSQEGRGAYNATAEIAAPLPPPETSPGTPVSASGTWSLWQGSLGPSDAEREGYHYDDYVVRFAPGRPRILSLEAEGFDAVLQILNAAGRDADPPEAIDGDDDAGAGFNAMLAFVPEEEGEYVVRVTSYAAGAAGAYRLWISQ